MNKIRKNNHIENLLVQYNDDDHFEGGKTAAPVQDQGGANCNFFPTKMYKTDSKTAKSLRQFMFLCMFCHVFLIAADFVIYKNAVVDSIWEAAVAYVCYFSIMSLQSFLIIVYCALLEVRFVMASLNIITIMTDSTGEDGSILIPFVYFLQLFFYAMGGYHCFMRFRAWRYRDPKTDSLTGGESTDEPEKKPKKKKEKKT